ncbi:hypothetical protein CN187_07800 [Sinorhizobium meliloti]|uniref:hypothetical protein n=1 Tax=Rhizobium meliloti TaxID=382 RepID=UPI000FD8618F|nr:hypothetical protein [Sinorhizobium meliloti]MDE3797704.1 hypothetical protein [Sinorhizobium meliloti]RVI69946.1 hypothetical protein CN187_07800 [Sinorhizobium meliloti]
MTMNNLSPDQQQLLGNLVTEAVEVLRRKGRMTELDALLSLQSVVALMAEGIVGSRPVAASLRAAADDVEKRARDPVRLPRANIVAGDEA